MQTKDPLVNPHENICYYFFFKYVLLVESGSIYSMCLKNIPGLFVHDLSVHIFAKNENVCFEISYGDDLHDPNQCIKRITFNNYIHLHGMFIDDKPEKKSFIL